MGSLGGQFLLYIDVVYVCHPLHMGHKGRTLSWKNSFDCDLLLRKNDVGIIKVLQFEGEQ